MNESRKFACRFSQTVVDVGDTGCRFDSQKSEECFGGGGVMNGRQFGLDRSGVGKERLREKGEENRWNKRAKGEEETLKKNKGIFIPNKVEHLLKGPLTVLDFLFDPEAYTYYK